LWKVFKAVRKHEIGLYRWKVEMYKKLLLLLL